MTDRLPILMHRRWALPILAELHRREGAKFVTLTHALDASPTAVRQSLDHLLETGLVRRNPGHGHPLRPEYILTRSGDRLAPACAAVDSTLIRLGLRDVGLRRWSLPIVRVVGEESPARFGQIARGLVDITDRALSLTLRELTSAAVIDRTVHDGSPPAALYRLGTPGRTLAPLVAAL
jgi:DNA-binding HxlR family transcriptional regulator